MTDAIGGYFGFELRKGEHYHRDALRLNTGRNCFEYVLRARNYTHVYIPYYTCEVMLESLHKLHIPYSFYSINEQLEPCTLPVLQSGEAFLYTNYYGLKQATVEQLANRYQSQLIVDNAQAFFAARIAGIDTFYTARKFFGVPDGAYLYTDTCLDIDLPQDESFERTSHLLKRLETGAEGGFADYQSHEEDLCHQSIKRMSQLTERILESIDYEAVKTIRRKNYVTLARELQTSNLLALSLSEDAIPMVYPYWNDKSFLLKKQLQEQRIYTATYWSNIADSNMVEGRLKNQLLPLPIDQRYGEEDMNQIIEIIKA